MAITVRVTENFGIEAELRQVSKKAARRMAETAYDLSQEIVPVKTGKLKKSGRTEDMAGPSARVAYGDAGEVHYAAAVHNRPEGRGFMFLRNSIMQARQMLAAAAVAYRQALKGTL